MQQSKNTKVIVRRRLPTITRRTATTALPPIAQGAQQAQTHHQHRETPRRMPSGTMTIVASSPPAVATGGSSLQVSDLITAVAGVNNNNLQQHGRRKTRIQSQMIRPNPLAQVVPQLCTVDLSNNGAMVKDYFEQHAWSVVCKCSKSDTRFHFKWVAHYKNIDYSAFSEGFQIVNHIENIDIITSKTGLLQTLKEFETNSRYLKMHSSIFTPETYILDLQSDKYSRDEKEFSERMNEGIWIHKPWNLNCGGGIKMVSNITRFKKELRYLKQDSDWIKRGKQFYSEYFTGLCLKSVIQKYIDRPLLLTGKKFDIRCYLLIACVNPLFVVFHHGYLRLSMQEYSVSDIESEINLFTHLTNAAVQKNHQDYEKNKENTIWSMAQFDNYCTQKYQRTPEQMRELYSKVKRMLTYTVHAAQSKLQRKLGCFELMGCDVLIDENFRPYLLELNTNPAIDLDTAVKLAAIPPVVNGTLDLVLDIHSNVLTRASRLQDAQNKLRMGAFEILINEATDFSYIGFDEEKSG